MRSSLLSPGLLVGAEWKALLLLDSDAKRMHVLSRSGATAGDKLSMLRETLFAGMDARRQSQQTLHPSKQN